MRVGVWHGTSLQRDGRRDDSLAEPLLDDFSADSSSSYFLRRYRAAFREESDPVAEAGVGGHGHPVQAHRLGGVEIPASVAHLAAFHYATGLASEHASVDTVEHLLAALASQGIDNALVELNHPEVPIMDGSAAPFVYLIQEAGVRRLNVPRRFLRVRRPLSLSQGDKRIALYPADELKVTYSIAFDHPSLRHQTYTARITEEGFAEEIAPARVRLPQGSGDVAPARPRAGRVA